MFILFFTMKNREKKARGFIVFYVSILFLEDLILIATILLNLIPHSLST